MLGFVFAPGIGLLVYLLFGRDGKAFSRRKKLLMHDLCPVRTRSSPGSRATAPSADG